MLIIIIINQNVLRWSEGPVINNVSPVLVEFKEEKDRCFIIIVITIILIIILVKIFLLIIIIIFVTILTPLPLAISSTLSVSSSSLPASRNDVNTSCKEELMKKGMMLLAPRP